MASKQADLFGGRTKLYQAFVDFDRENPQVYRMFCSFAFRMIRRGFKHYGAATIFEAMRFHSDLKTTGDKWKLNNNHRAYYARKFMAEHPEHEVFFETRRVGESFEDES